MDLTNFARTIGLVGASVFITFLGTAYWNETKNTPKKQKAKVMLLIIGVGIFLLIAFIATA